MLKLLAKTLIALLALSAVGCAEAADESSESTFITQSQKLSPSLNFAKAPEVYYWGTTANEIGPNGAVFMAGWFSPDNKLSFGCETTMFNPANSGHDGFVVKFNPKGNCEWQRSFGSLTDDPYTRIDYQVQDIAIDQNEHVLVAHRLTYEPRYPGGSYTTSSLVRELDGSGSQVWLESMTAYLNVDAEVEITDIDVDNFGNVVAVGRHDHYFVFGGQQSPDPRAEGTGTETFVLSWGPLSNGDRSQNWYQSFGGVDYAGCDPANLSCPLGNVPTDVAVHRSTGVIAVVGNYDGHHTSVGGKVADEAYNWNIFIQTLDRLGEPLDAKSTMSSSPQSNPPGTELPGETEWTTAAAFSPSGELYVGGSFKGMLKYDPDGLANVMGSFDFHLDTDLAATPDNLDWFIVSYTDPYDLTESIDQWQHSQLYGAGSDVDRERLHDIEATDIVVSIVGSACDADVECASVGFADVFNAAASIPARNSFNDYLLTFEKSSPSVEYVAVDSSGTGTLVVGGQAFTKPEFDAKLNLHGGFGFVASYGLGL
jgi:hypothetical protein